MSRFERISGFKPNFSRSVAVVGAGPTALYFLKHVVDNRFYDIGVTFFSDCDSMGAGMSYDLSQVGRESLDDVACGQVPDLDPAPHRWFQAQSDEWLLEHGIDRRRLGCDFVAPRHLMGQYFDAQFQMLLMEAAKAGISIRCLRQTAVTDLFATNRGITVAFSKAGSRHEDMETFDFVVVATDHRWPIENIAGSRYLLAPPPTGTPDYPQARHIGLIGTSLGAIETCLTLARNHGSFCRDIDGRLKYLLHEEKRDFSVVMHSRRGLLPPLHGRSSMASVAGPPCFALADIDRHLDEKASLSLDFLFDRVVKTAVRQKSPDLYSRIKAMNFETFAGFLEESYRARDPLRALKEDYMASAASVRDRAPLFWQEILHELSGTWNAYARFLDARDAIRLRDCFMPLVRYLAGLMPQQSCEQILALHEAGCLSVVSVGSELCVDGETGSDDRIALSFSDPQTGAATTLCYDLIVDCRERRPVGLECFPFRTLVRQQIVTDAKLRVEKVGKRGGGEIALGGINVDERFHPISAGGTPIESIFVVSGPMIAGVYPYHWGLPFRCNMAATAVKELRRKVAAAS